MHPSGDVLTDRCKYVMTHYLVVLQMAYRSGVGVCHFKKSVCLCHSQHSPHALHAADTLHSGWQVNNIVNIVLCLATQTQKLIVYSSTTVV